MHREYGMSSQLRSDIKVPQWVPGVCHWCMGDSQVQFAKCDVEHHSFSRNEHWSGDALSIYSFDGKSKTHGQC